jgi:hypothetical protein
MEIQFYRGLFNIFIDGDELRETDLFFLYKFKFRKECLKVIFVFLWKYLLCRKFRLD